MATITITTGIIHSGISKRFGVRSTQLQNVTGTKFRDGSQTVTTTRAAIDIGNVPAANQLLLYARNLDPTNFVDLYIASSGGLAFARLRPSGAPLQLPLPPTNVVHAQADTASCEVEISVIAETD